MESESQIISRIDELNQEIHKRTNALLEKRKALSEQLVEIERKNEEMRLSLDRVGDETTWLDQYANRYCCGLFIVSKIRDDRIRIALTELDRIEQGINSMGTLDVAKEGSNAGILAYKDEVTRKNSAELDSLINSVTEEKARRRLETNIMALRVAEKCAAIVYQDTERIDFIIKLQKEFNKIIRKLIVMLENT